jgi:uncharacterized protein YaeQ
MMIRCVVFALHASDALEFGRGLSDADEPDLFERDLTGALQLWIEVGQPDERFILKACSRAERVLVYAYSASTPIWWKAIAEKLGRARNLSVRHVAQASSAKLATFAERTMSLQCTIHDREVWVRNGRDEVQVEITDVFPLLEPRDQ